MLSIDMDFWGDAYDALERLAGPLQPMPSPVGAFETFLGDYRGEPLAIQWQGRARSDPGTGAVLKLGAALGDLPIRTYVWNRKRSTIFGPTAETGDAAFDATYVASARPPEVVSRALDAEVRTMIDRRWGGKDTSIDAKDGWVTLEAGRSGAGPRGPRVPPTADELQQSLDDVVLLARRLRTAYETTRAAILADQGAEAAAAWERSAREDMEESRTTGRLVAAAVVVGFLAVAALVTWLVLAIV